MRVLKRFILVSLSLGVVLALALGYLLRGSLAELDGERTLAGLTAPVQVARDALGVVTIGAANRQDAAFATGFVHAQERFFQMDLMRRLAAGELAALVGEGAAEHDMRQRIHRMRDVARRVMGRAGDGERAIIESYAAGVNAGVDALAVRPFEYLILRESPSEWLAEDTVLVVLAMYFRLHDERATRESQLARLRDGLPPALFAFVTQTGTEWDAPLLGEAMTTLPVPDAAVCDVRRAGRDSLAGDTRLPGARAEAFVPVGSNAWAVSAERTRRGVALLANDMHLGLSLPNTWFRLRLLVADPTRPGEDIDVSGVTLPGTPALVAGSNGHVAWGLTNTYGDWVDLVVLDVDPQDPQRYRTADGWQAFLEHEEVVHIHGAPSRTQVVRSTIWGPVMDSDAHGRPRALRWLAHAPQATNLGLLRMETARDVQQAMQVAHTSGIPPQNLILADSDGNIAWTIMGKIPRQRGYDGRLPASWADAGRGWSGWLPPADYPRVVNPASGAVWSANARVADGEALRAIGDGGYALGARATQIRDSLLALEDAAEADMLAVQLDDRALFLARWRELLLQALAADTPPGNARRAELRRVLQASAQRAAVDDAGYRLLRAFRRQLAERVFASIVNLCGGLDASAIGGPPRQWEGAVWRILEERPPHLLDPRYASWEALLLASADAAIQECPGGDLAGCTWGKANVVTIRHPLSAALPLLARWLDMPAESLPGDTHMPRVQGPSMGASQRFAVAPGDESSGYFHMPGGQSGHPLSPFYAAGHRAWAEGRATPFLPGAEEHLLRLLPAS